MLPTSRRPESRDGQNRSRRSGWLLDGLVGVVAGGVVGAIVAVNFIITIGIGYDVGIGGVFEHSLIAGVITMLILISGPLLGILMMRWLRQRR